MKNSGAALMEILASVIICAPILIGLALIISKSSGVIFLATSLHDRVILSRRVEAIVSKVGADIDSHRLPLLPRSHQPGRLTYADTTPLILNVSRTENVPSDSSSSLSYLTILPNHSRWVTQRHGNNSITACRSAPLGDLPPHIRGVIAVSPDGIEDMRASLLPGDLTQRCITTQLTRHAHSMITRTGAIEVDSISLIVPIAATYTYFISRGGELRYLSHYGERVIEHQPIHENVLRMTPSVQFDPVSGFTELSLEALTRSTSVNVAAVYPGRLGRLRIDEALIASSYVR